VYDPVAGTWAARANMPTARGLFGTSAVGGTIYAIGGTSRGRDKLAVVEAYDTATDTWTRRADMPTPRNALSAAVVDGRIYAIGGWGYDRPKGGWESIDPTATGQDFSTAEVYDPAQKAWIVPIPGTTQMAHMLENTGAAAVRFTQPEIAELNASVVAIKIECARLPEMVQAMSGVEAAPKN
jgi:hypothetical protein